ncbi:MAG: nucleotidyltransferase family protein [Patescibacteria group bacterium]|nr:nucleotidyltransferase family protein [Patescibacteria group bacterium]
MPTITKAIILAGGKGSRLHPVTLEIPKPLIPIRKQPLINYNLNLFACAGATDVVVIIRPEDKPDYERWAREWGSEFTRLGMGIQFFEEPEPMGTFGFIFHRLRGWAGDQDFFVSNGDEIKTIDLRKMVLFHQTANVPATVSLVVENERKDCGFVVVKEGRIVEFLEKQLLPPSNLMSAGLYALSPTVFEAMAVNFPTGKVSLMFETDLFPALAKSQKLAGFVDERGKVFDCGTFERWEKAIREV